MPSMFACSASLNGISNQNVGLAESSWATSFSRGIYAAHKAISPNVIIYFIIHSKYFPADWLKPHAQFTITSCCSPNLERIFVILNQWRQKWSVSRIIEPMTSKWRQKWSRRRLLNCWPRKPGDKVVLYLVSGKTKSVTPLRRRKYFEWILKQLLNSAFVGYEEFCWSRRVLSTSAFDLCG